MELLSHPRRIPSAFFFSHSLDGDYNLLLHTKSKEVSRKHVEIVYKDGQWWVRNISRFGTSVFRDGVKKRLTGGWLRGKTKQLEAEESNDQEGARSDEGTSRQRATSTPDIYTNGRLAKGPKGSGVDTERSTVQSGEREGEGVGGGEGEGVGGDEGEGEGGDKGEDEGKGEGEDKGEDEDEDKGGAEGWAEDGDPDANQTLDEDQDSAPLVGFGIMIMGSSLVGFMPYELCQQVRWHRPYTLPG